MGEALASRTVIVVVEKFLWNWQRRHSLHPNCPPATCVGALLCEIEDDCSEGFVLSILPCLWAISIVVPYRTRLNRKSESAREAKAGGRKRLEYRLVTALFRILKFRVNYALTKGSIVGLSNSRVNALNTTNQGPLRLIPSSLLVWSRS